MGKRVNGRRTLAVSSFSFPRYPISWRTLYQYRVTGAPQERGRVGGNYHPISPSFYPETVYLCL